MRGRERVESIDVLRGFALLGILLMNIVGFAWPFVVYENPLLAGVVSRADLVEWFVAHLFFDLKMMSIFSMLFGAGVVLMTDRAEARGVSALGIYYRRIFWLLVIGLLHAYLLWEGDILVPYALCGLVLYPFRRLSARTLFITGCVVALISLPLTVGWGYSMARARDNAALAEQETLAGKTVDPSLRDAKKTWEEMRSNFLPSPSEIAEDIQEHRGGYVSLLRHRAPTVYMLETLVFITFFAWRAGGMMLVGMALMKWRVFEARCSPGFYARLMWVGYGVGLPIIALGAFDQYRHDFDSVHNFQRGSVFNYLGSIPVALGHVGLVMWIYQSGRLAPLTRRLAAVGRTALSNYLFQTILCTTLFNGYGFNLFARIPRAELPLIVLAIWVLQLWLSPLWLKHFRFGPAEWVWRSLTYARRQPMLVGHAVV
ncbi:MAG: DUF418 domain-containing protein [Isosphaeraceae bacterium]